MKNVIIVDNSLYPTGALKSILTITNKLKDEFNFIYITPSELIKDELIKQNKNVYLIKFLELAKDPKSLLYPWVLLWNSWKLYQIIRKEKVDIIHVNDLYNMVGVIVKIFYSKIMLIHHIRLLPDSYAKMLYYRWIYIINKKADKLICVSSSVFNAIKSSDKKIIIYDTIENKEIYPAKEIITQKLKTQLIYIGNFVRGKGQDFAARVLKKLLEFDLNVELTYIGLTNPDNKYFDEIVSYLKAEYIFEKVIFKRFTNDIEKEIKSGDILINFSESESFSMVCLESLYYGTPIVCTDCGGPSELIKNYESGILVKNKCIEDMVTAINYLIENPENQSLYSKAGKRYVREKFSLTEMCSKLKMVYNS